MVKVLTFITRKAGMPLDDFQRYWRERHPDAVTKLPGIRRYVQSHVLPSMYARGEPPHDGIAEVWADDTSALRQMTQSSSHPALIEDESRFIDRTRMGVLITEDDVTLDGTPPPGAIKAVECFRKKPTMPVESFRQHWHERHAPLAARVPGVRRYVASLVRPSAYGPNRAPQYDGAAFMWFDSMESLKSAAATPQYKALITDRENFLTAGEPPFLLTREYVIVA